MEYCPSSGAPVDLLISKLEQAGLTPTDIHHIEYLSDRAVLEQLPGGFRWLKRNVREDVILYFEAYACLLEMQLQMAHYTEQLIQEALIGEKQDRKVETVS